MSAPNPRAYSEQEISEATKIVDSLRNYPLLQGPEDQRWRDIAIALQCELRRVQDALRVHQVACKGENGSQ